MEEDHLGCDGKCEIHTRFQSLHTNKRILDISSIMALMALK